MMVGPAYTVKCRAGDNLTLHAALNFCGKGDVLVVSNMEEGRKLLEDAGHTIIEGRGFETEDVLADMKEHQPDAMIVRITPINREVIESNLNLKVIVRHGAGFDVLAYDPFKPAADFPDGVEVVRDLDRIFKESDYVSVHCPNTPVSHHIVNAKTLAMMKPIAFNMAMQISKYATIGIPFAKCIELCTVAPALHMGMLDTIGSLAVGHAADVAVFRPVERENVFGDRPYGNKDQTLCTGNVIYQPVLTLKDGEMVYRDVTF